MVGVSYTGQADRREQRGITLSLILFNQSTVLWKTIVVRQNATVRGHQLYLRIELQEQPIGEQAVYTVLIEREQPVRFQCFFGEDPSILHGAGFDMTSEESD